MTTDATFHPDLEDLLPPIPDDSIVSRSVPAGEGIRATLFGFAPGQELSEHTAARPAILHFLRGHARLTLGQKDYSVEPGAWAHLPENLSHSIHAQDEVVMLLLLVG